MRAQLAADPCTPLTIEKFSDKRNLEEPTCRKHFMGDYGDTDDRTEMLDISVVSFASSYKGSDICEPKL